MGERFNQEDLDILLKKPGKRTATFIAVLALTAASGCIGAKSVGEKTSTQGTNQTEMTSGISGLNLISAMDWHGVPGVVAVKDSGSSKPNIARSLQVNHVGMEIVEQNGSGGEENTPVNLNEQYIKPKGDFVVSYTISNLKGEGSVNLYGEPPIILDEARFDRQGVRIAIEDGSFWVGLNNGKNDNLAEEKEFHFDQQKVNKVTMTRKDGDLIFNVNGEELGKIKEDGIFNTDEIWVGLDSTGSYTLNEFRADSVVPGNINWGYSAIENVKRDPNGFQSIADRNGLKLKIGAAVSLGPLESDARYAEIAGGWYGSWTTENALKMQFIHPQPNVYTFGEADNIIKLAAQHNIDVHAHTLVFGEANPHWVQDIAKNHPEKLAGVMLDHIRTVGKHLNQFDNVKSVDVVNEPLSDYESYSFRKNIWYNAMGEDYIFKAFREARKVMPHKDLYMNEYGIEANDERTKLLFNLIDRMQANGVPIDGIGLQAHVYEHGDQIYPEDLRNVIRLAAKRGLKVRISEMDVYGHNTNFQAEQFAEVLKVCAQEPNCVNFSVWGIDEQYSSTSYIDGNGQYEIGDGLPFDAKGRPLRAAAAIQKALESVNK